MTRPASPAPDKHRLEASMASDTTVLLLRRFRAPPALVFEAFTEPALIRRWMLGPDGWEMPVCTVDLRPGGEYHHTWRKEGEPDLVLVGTFVEVEPPRRTVAREEFKMPWSPGSTLVTTEFEPDASDGATGVGADAADGTLVRMTIEFPNLEARDAALATGMTKGMETGYQRLDEILADRTA